jgi:hypothetical protein
MSGPENSAGAATAPSPPPAAVLALGRAIPTEVRRAFRARPRVRDAALVGCALLIAITTIGLTWWTTRPQPGPARGNLVVLSVPEGAEVLVDEVLVGETPFASSSLGSGSHTVQVRKAGWVAQVREVEVVPHRVVELKFALQPTR